MTHTARKTLIASLAAMMIGMTAFAAPADAGGSVSLTYVPKNKKDAKNLQTGLAIYGLVNAMQNGANIKQLGKNNAAGIGQNGLGNYGVVYQEGKGHNGTLQQNGNSNSYGIFQFGKGTNANVVQNGNGKAGATFAFGW